MLGLVEKGGLSSGSSVSFDKLFISFLLLDEISKRGIGGQVTITQNRLENAAVPSRQTKKTERGPYGCSTGNRVNEAYFGMTQLL